MITANNHQPSHPIARKLFCAQLYQTALLNTGEFRFADFLFTRVWIQGTVTQITDSFFLIDDASHPPHNSDLPPSAGIVQVDLRNSTRAAIAEPSKQLSLLVYPFLKVGAEVAVIGQVRYDQEAGLFAIGIEDQRVLDKSTDADSASRWALDVVRVHEQVYFPMK